MSSRLIRSQSGTRKAALKGYVCSTPAQPHSVNVESNLSSPHDPLDHDTSATRARMGHSTLLLSCRGRTRPVRLPPRLPMTYSQASRISDQKGVRKLVLRSRCVDWDDVPIRQRNSNPMNAKIDRVIVCECRVTMYFFMMAYLSLLCCAGGDICLGLAMS